MTLRSQRLSLEALVEGIIVEEDGDACDLDGDTTYAEESYDSNTADSEFEIEEEQGSIEGSTEGSTVQYSRPVTRRTMKKEESLSEPEGIVTRSKISRENKEKKEELDKEASASSFNSLQVVSVLLNEC